MVESREAELDSTPLNVNAGHILMADDEADIRDVFREALTESGHQVVVASTAEEALERLQAEDFDVVVTDLHFEGMDGLELCAAIAANRPGVPVIVVTGFGGLGTAVSAIRAGAYDFVTKPVQVDAFLLAVNRALQHRRLELEVKRLQSAVEAREHPDSMVGSSEVVRKVFDRVNRGTGKELVARERTEPIR